MNDGLASPAEGAKVFSVNAYLGLMRKGGGWIILSLYFFYLFLSVYLFNVSFSYVSFC